MSQKMLLENDKIYMQEKLDSANQTIAQLKSEIEALKSEHERETQQKDYDYSLKERDINLNNIKKIGKYKTDIENLASEKQKLEMNYHVLQNENNNFLNENNRFAYEKQENQILTNRLLEHLKTKIIEKHRSNQSLQSNLDELQNSFQIISTENEELKSALESFQEIERAIQTAVSLK